MTTPHARTYARTGRTCTALATLAGKLEAALKHGCDVTLEEVAADVEGACVLARLANAAALDTLTAEELRGGRS